MSTSSTQQTTVVLVTGANQGVGYAVAEQVLAKMDGVIVYVGARDIAKGKTACEALNASKGRLPNSLAVPLLLDLTSDESIAEAAKSVPHLDVLVNNAAISGLTEVQTMDPVGSDLASLVAQREMFRTLYETNVFGSVAVINAFSPQLQRSASEQRSHLRTAIINVSSGAGSLSKYAALPHVQPTPHGGPSHYYGSSKTALNAFTIFYSKLHPEIRVVSASPGFVKTQFNHYAGTQTPAEGAQFITDLIFDKDGRTCTYISSGKSIGW